MRKNPLLLQAVPLGRWLFSSERAAIRLVHVIYCVALKWKFLDGWYCKLISEMFRSGEQCRLMEIKGTMLGKVGARRGRDVECSAQMGRLR